MLMSEPIPHSPRSVPASISGSNSPTRAIRALHVFGSLNRGGAETWLMDVVRRVDRSQLAIDVCLLKPGLSAYEPEFQSLGGTILRCSTSSNIAGFSPRFRALLTTGQYDVVHSHVYYFSGLILRVAARAGVPIRVAHNHPVEDLKHRRPARAAYAWLMKRWMRAYGTHFVGPTKASVEAMWGANWRENPRVSVLYNGIDVSRFQAEPDRPGLRRELNLPDDARIVLNVGRFVPHKRQALLVEVARHLCTIRPEVYFLLIGAGALKEDVEAKVAAAGLTDRFRFVDGAPNLDRYWLSSDCFAFPSVNEGFGIVIAEAGAAGLPVVACDIPGVTEAATACRTVRLLPPDAALEHWVNSLDLLLKHSLMARDQRFAMLAGFPFTIHKSIQSLIQLYRAPLVAISGVAHAR